MRPLLRRSRIRSGLNRKRSSSFDFLAIAFECRVLRPLTWFGLLETRRVGEPGSFAWRYVREYRVAPLFDRALVFDAQIAPAGGAHH